MKNKKYRIQRDLVFLTLSMVVIVFLWVGSNIYNAHVTSTIDEVLQTQIIPINGKFDTDTIEQLKDRKKVMPNFTELSISEDPQIEPELELEAPATSSATEPVQDTPFVTPENPDALL